MEYIHTICTCHTIAKSYMKDTIRKIINTQNERNSNSIILDVHRNTKRNRFNIVYPVIFLSDTKKLLNIFIIKKSVLCVNDLVALVYNKICNYK